ncbi:kanadaptin [Bufo bufo]|uniref:kanadaptin n=1 Tax=Bufo bufo TaxID=8384 RepID=UPI001ABECCC2|nr:kanadaptin [Bufo bufo]
MEAAQLSPHDGERPLDPETLEARHTDPTGGNEAACHGDGGTQGPYVPGVTRLENTGARDDETPRDGHTEGPRSPRATIDEGSDASRSEGLKDPGSWSDQGCGNSRTSSHQACGDPRAPSNEGPRTDSHETSTSSHSKGTSPDASEGPRNDETTGRLRSGCSKGTSPDASEGSRNDETTGSLRSGCSKETSSDTNEGPGDPGAFSSHSEEPENGPNDARGSSPDQRLTGSNEPQGIHSARGADEGPDVARATESCVSRSKDPTEQPQGNGSRGSTMEISSKGAESFKKPIAPSWNEKTLDQRSKPSCSAPISPQSVPPVSSETASDHSARLPSDAYRSSPAIPYREPPWSGLPQALYSLEVIKGGSILSTKSLNGASWTVFGRLPTCHVSLEHPSVSRYHAVLQYRSVPGSEPDQEPGYYVYDLGSTHGTFVNKQRIQPKTYCRVRVGHVLKFGGSTRLFILQGPDEDLEAESELTVTQIKEVRRQKESLQKRMLGDDSDEEDGPEEGEEKEQKDGGSEGAGCTWGMGEDAMEEEEEENDVNPIAVEYLAEREASYSGNPKKALQGFFDREGEELDFEYEERGIGSWLCRVKLPVDDSAGKQLVAEVVHSGKKRDAMRLCSLEACRMLDMRGLLRQEAVSRKRKTKQWEDEDFYDSDDDTFLDRTGVVEKKRLNRMKKAGKVEEKPETYESLTAKLDLVEKEITEIAAKLKTNRQDEAQTSAQDSLDAFMTEMKSGAAIDSVTRKKLHLQSLELKKEQQRLKSLIKIVQPTKLPELKTDSAAQDSKTKKLTLPMFGAMKGGSKFKLKTGTVGRIPPKRTDLPSSLFTMKGDSNEPEEEEEEEEDEIQMDTASKSHTEHKTAPSGSIEQSPDPRTSTCPTQAADVEEKIPCKEPKKKTAAPGASHGAPNVQSPPAAETKEEEAARKTTTVRQRKMLGPSRPPQGVSSASYPEDNPDYCVWTPPAGQTGDGKTHLNEKYGY